MTTIFWTVFTCVAFGHLLPGCALNKPQLLKKCAPGDGFFRTPGGDCTIKPMLYGIQAERYGLKCDDEEFQCRPVFKCIPRFLINSPVLGGCRGTRNVERITVPCRADEFACKRSSICLPRWSVRDGKLDCISKSVSDDDSDETTKPYEICLRHEFRCAGTGRCIPRQWIMDGAPDCPGSYDEDDPLPNCHEGEEFRCGLTGRCLPRYLVMDGFADCSNRTQVDDSDERKPISCNSTTEFHCISTGRCIPRSWILNGVENCEDGSDEKVRRGFKCMDDEFNCLNKRRCIPRKYLCDGMDHCGDCSDEVEACGEHPRMWRCPSDALDPYHKTCILQSYRCDATTDCPNGTDEVIYLPGFKCDVGSLSSKRSCSVPQWSLEDGHTLCDDKADECFQENDGKRTFHCNRCADNTTIISQKQVCDGFVDCTDLWDECLCTRSTTSSTSGVGHLCDSVCYATESDACLKCQTGQLYCRLDEKCINKTMLCDGLVDCPLSQLDESYCIRDYTPKKFDIPSKQLDFDCWTLQPEILQFISKIEVGEWVDKLLPKRGKWCDGVLDCSRFEDECTNCSTTLKECTKFPVTYISSFIPVFPQSHPEPARTCRDFDDNDLGYLDIITPSSLCNGVQECSDLADEDSCEGRFSCDGGDIQWLFGVRKIVSIEMKKVCDSTIDCVVDETDEKNCSADTHFYCESGKPLFVSKSLVRNGKQDCDDNSDECPPHAYDNNPFSSRFEMIGNSFLRNFLWIMATLALLGNAGAICETFFINRRLKGPQVTGMGRCNRMLLANLALSDFFMGVALLAIGIKSSLMSGKYCSEENQWRISGGCSTIGSFIVISSETSVFTLAILTYYRLYSVVRPFQSKNVGIKRAAYAIIAAWCLSATLAVFPLIPTLNQSALTHALVSPSIYFNSTIVNWTDFRTFAVRVIALSNSSSHVPKYGFSTWSETVSRLRDSHTTEPPEVHGYFGYYSAHGVCIPRLFRSKGAPPLHPLTLLVMSVNFCCLLFILFSYIAIYRKSASRGKIAGSAGSGGSAAKNNRTLETKITILIGTDFCCWFPICVMTFLGQAGIDIPLTAYAVAATVLLPINSSLNPLIYSDAFKFTREIWMKKFREWRQP